MERLLNIDCDPGQLSALNLAFVGDTVFDLFVRESLVCGANRPVKKQHTLAASRVKAAAPRISALKTQTTTPARVWTIRESNASRCSFIPRPAPDRRTPAFSLTALSP